MRKVASYLFISLDGVVESPDQFVRPDLYEDFDPIIGEVIAEQDAVILGRKTYEEWAPFWPNSEIQPFANFINPTPKYVASRTLNSVDWENSHLMSGDLTEEVTRLKAQPGRTIGVHGSIALVQSMLAAGLLDELWFTLVPSIAGHGRRLFTREGDAIQLDLISARTTPHGLQILAYRPTASR